MPPALSRLAALLVVPPALATRTAAYQLGYLAGTRERWLAEWRGLVWLGPNWQALEAGQVVYLLEEGIAALTIERQER